MSTRTRHHLLTVAVGLALVSDAGHARPPGLDIVALTGAAAGDNFGMSVKLVGDVTGDGVGDVAVGAPYADVPFSAAGAVFVYAGGPGRMNAAPDFMLTGRSQDEHFGISIAGGMDLNGDGIADLAIGARFNDLGGQNAGAVYVFLGGPTLADNQHWIILPGEASDDWFGQSVAHAGDVNGDGYGDIIVGAPYNDAAANAAGRAYIYFGGPTMTTTPSLVLPGPAQAHAHFGWAVAGAGDVNNDGYSDVIVGARLFGMGPNSARGRAFIYFGGPVPDAVPDVILDGVTRDDWFGDAVSGARDVNGDGFDDVIVGAKFADAAGSGAGAAYLFRGGAPMPTSPLLTFIEGEPNAQLGFAVAGGDVNSDGYSDALVSAHFAAGPAGPASGKVYVYFGAPVPNAVADLVTVGEAADDQFGESVSAGGRASRFDGPSFLVGAHYNDAAGNGAGRAYLFTMVPGCPIDLTADGEIDLRELYAWHASPSDVDANGTTDDADRHCLTQYLRRHEPLDMRD